VKTAPDHLTEDGFQVFVRRADRFDVEVLHQHVQHLGSDEGREARAESDAFDSQVQERQQNGYRFCSYQESTIDKGSSLTPTLNALESATAI
jgi:hypothetical protein